ncbi:hypothetical protein IMZ48_29520, partial [Candidatus Bathyarchaeota archaeon]|nr:hypothetical protein [Candidatus Bathyarchaeota archaeon]
FEGGDDLKGTIENELRGCYGDTLRASVVRPAEEAREAYPGDTGDEKLGACHEEMDDLNTRMRGLRDAGRAWWAWSAERGVLHDTVLALRADGEPTEMLPFRVADELGDKLVVVRSAGDGYAYCPRMTGGVGVGTSSPYNISPLLHPSARLSSLTSRSTLRQHHLRHPRHHVPLPEPIRRPIPPRDCPPSRRQRRGARLLRVRRPSLRPAARRLSKAGVCGRLPCFVVS